MITVRVRRNTRIANPVTLLVVPLNYAEYIDSGFVQPLDFPEVPPENVFTPNRAKSKTYTSIYLYSTLHKTLTSHRFSIGPERFQYYTHRDHL